MFVTTDPRPYSSAIDAGDLATPEGSEVVPNGSRINLGRYGGTAEASKSPASGPTVENRTVTTNVNVAWRFPQSRNFESVRKTRYDKMPSCEKVYLADLALGEVFSRSNSAV